MTLASLPLWASITLYVLGGIVLFIYLGIPLLMLATVRLAADPEPRRVELDDLPGPLILEINERKDELERAGYTHHGSIAIDDVLPNMTWFGAMFLGPDGRSIAAAQAFVSAPPDGSRRTERVFGWAIESESVDGREIVTTGPQSPEHVFGEAFRSVLQVRSERRFDRLAEYHKAHVNAVAGRNVKPSPSIDALPGEMARGLRRLTEAHRDAGYRRLVDDRYRLTPRGAFILGWTLMPPACWVYWRKMNRFARELARTSPYLADL